MKQLHMNLDGCVLFLEIQGTLTNWCKFKKLFFLILAIYLKTIDFRTSMIKLSVSGEFDLEDMLRNKICKVRAFLTMA